MHISIRSSIKRNLPTSRQVIETSTRLRRNHSAWRKLMPLFIVISTRRGLKKIQPSFRPSRVVAAHRKKSHRTRWACRSLTNCRLAKVPIDWTTFVVVYPLPLSTFLHITIHRTWTRSLASLRSHQPKRCSITWGRRVYHHLAIHRMRTIRERGIRWSWSTSRVRWRRISTTNARYTYIRASREPRASKSRIQCRKLC